MTDAQYVPPIYLDEATGLHYIIGRKHVLFDNGVKVPRDAFNSRASYKKSIGVLVREAAEDPENCGWDFQHAVQTTNLARAKSRRKTTVIRPSIEAQARQKPAQATPELVEEIPALTPVSVAADGSVAAATEQAVVVEADKVKPTIGAAMGSGAAAELPAGSWKTVVVQGAGSEAEKKASTPIVEALREPEPAPEPPTRPTSRLRAFFSVPYNDVILMIATVGVLCAAMSVYHTFMFLVNAGKSDVVAAITAVAMVTFSATAYTVARRLLQDSGIGFIQRTFFALFLIVMGTGTIGFCAFSTINVSYSQLASRQVAATEAVVGRDVGVAGQKETLADLQAQLDSAIADVATYSTRANQLYEATIRPLPTAESPDDPALRQARVERDAATRAYNAATKALEAAKAKRDSLYAKKAAARDAHTEAVTTAAASDVSSYAAVAKRLGTTEDTFKFIIDVIPAVFFDVVAPFAIAVAMLLKDRRNGLTKTSAVSRLIASLTSKGGKNG